jgi:two-component system, chemotaxis family, CheB/CheR fusion protein
VSDLVSTLVGYERLGADVVQVLSTLRSHEEEVQTRKGQWYLMRIQPYRTIENVIEGAVITLVNITEYKHMQQTLTETEHRLAEMRQAEERLNQDAERLGKLALFMRDAKEAVIIQDYNDEIISWNPAAAELYGWPESEVVGHKSDVIVPPAERTQRQEVIERLRTGETVPPYTAVRRTKGGQEIRVLVTSYLLYSGEGEVYGFATTERPVAAE